MKPKISTFLLLTLLALVHRSVQQCPSGYESWGTGCYNFNLAPTNWQKARQACKESQPTWNVDLAVFDTKEENDWVVDRLKAISTGNPLPQWFIGVYYDSLTKKIVVVTGEKGPYNKPTDVPFMNWTTDATTIGGDVSYATFNTAALNWYIGSGSASQRFVCELALKPTGICDTARSWYNGPDQQCHKILYVPSGFDWYQSRTKCQEEQASLVKITDSATNDMAYRIKPIGSLLIRNDIWIGGKSSTNGSSYSWSWLDNSAVGYSDWNSGGGLIANATNYDKQCILYTSVRTITPGRWSAGQCSSSAAYAWCARTPFVCRPGWVSENNMCYLYVTERLTWDNANAYCTGMKARLVMPYTNYTQNYLKGVLADFSGAGISYVWAGLRQQTLNGEYVWASNEPYPQTHWLGGENTKTMLNLGCARMNAEARDARWSATSCNDINGFICEVKLGTEIQGSITIDPPPVRTCDPGWTFLSDRSPCYIYRAVQKTWDAASTDCKALGGTLVTLTNGNEQQDIMNSRITSARNAEFWSGLRRESNTSDRYRWLDGALNTLKFTNWDDTKGAQISNEGLCGIAYTANSGDQSGRWNMRSCTTAKPYMCKKGTTINLLTTTATPAVDNLKYCGGNGWTTDAYSSSCYQYHEDTQTTWQSAQLACESYGGNLLSIQDPTERRLIQQQISAQLTVPSIWLGLSSVGRVGYYEWSDRSPGVYYNWDTKQPSSDNACVIMFANTGKWAVTSCTNKRGFICKKPKAVEKPTTQPPVTQPVPSGQEYSCKTGYTRVPGTMKCVALFLKSANFATAQQACGIEGGTLASVDSLEENQVLYSLYHNVFYSAWIGLEDSTPTSEEIWFKWTDGTVPTFTHWQQNQPTNTQTTSGERQDCVYFHPTAVEARWADYYCSATLSAYFCQIPTRLAPIVTTPVPEGCPLHDAALPAAVLDAYCYYFSWMQSAPYNTAQSQCRSFGGNLVSINSQQEQTFLSVELLNRGYDFQFYIGLYGSRDNLYWSDGGKPTFTNFAPDVVLPAYPSSTCVTIGGGKEYHGLWYTSNCGVVNHFICKVQRKGWTFPPTVTTTRPPRDLMKCGDLFPQDPVVDMDDYCFVIKGSKIYSPFNQQTFTTANTKCKQLGTGTGYLATIQNTTVNQMIVDAATSVNFLQHKLWIGLSVGSEGNGFRWQSNAPYYYNNFAPKQPGSTAASTCVYIDEDGFWYTSDCFQLRNYVCLVPKPHISANATLPPAFTIDPAASAACGGGNSWALVTDKCYWMSNNYYKSWYDANAYCQSLNATLTSITNEGEQLFLQQLTRDYFSSEYTWIGLNELDHDSYKWADGSPLGINNWDQGQPNDNWGAQLCVAMRSQTGKWVDEDCTRTFPFICKKWLSGAPAMPTTAPPSGNCPPKFQRFGSKCFLVNTDQLVDNVGARNACAAFGRGVFPASVLNAQEQAFLVSMMRTTTTQVWIGLVNKGEQGIYDYKWLSEEPYTYSNWAYNQPDTSGNTGTRKSCIKMSDTTTEAGRWYEETCHTTLHYACSTYISPNNPPETDGCKPNYQRSGNSCYQVSTVSPNTWFKARDSCALSGSTLVTIMNIYEQSFLLSQTSIIKPSTAIWIGLQTTTTGVSTWYNGWPVLYTNWNYNQPIINDRYQCVAMNSTTGKWFVDQCSVPHAYVCRDTTTFNDPMPEYPPDEDIDVPGPCPTSQWITIGSYCYYINTTLARPFGEQNSFCRSLGAVMASVPSLRVHEMLVATIQEQQTSVKTYYDPWIGYLQAGGALEAIDGAPINFVNWQNGEMPQSSSSDAQCVFINGQSGYWLMQSCNSRLGVVCRKSKGELITGPTRATTTNAAPADTSTRTHHSRPTLPQDELTTAVSGGDDTTLIILLVVGAVTGVLTVAVMAVVYLSRTKPHLMPAAFVNLFGASASSSDSADGIENAVYEAPSSVIDKSQSSGLGGIEGPATIEGGTI